MRRCGGFSQGHKSSSFLPTLLGMQALLTLTSCCSGIGCGSAQKHMETVNKMGERPFVIAFRSYSGSRVALHNAANDLLTASGVISYAAGGSDFEWYHDQERKHDFLASATLFKSDLPVERILGMMAAVEERLGGPQREPAPLMKMDLMWVEGVEMETPELTLPNPLIFEKFWASYTFVEASEDAMFRSRDEGREKTSTVRRVARAYKKFKDIEDPAMRFFFRENSLGEGKADLSRKPGGTIYSQGAFDDIDTLAIAGDLLLFAEADVIRGRDPKTPPIEDDEDAYLSLRGTVEKLQRDAVLALQVPTDAKATVDERAQAWVDGLAGLLAVHHFVGRQTVIYSADVNRISGAVVGHAAPDSKPYFHRGDVAVSSERLADMPINRNAQEEARDSRRVMLSTLYRPRALPSPQ
jgi:7,8-dihydro-6-hydroxymethylpterin-pyrophosphokinase